MMSGNWRWKVLSDNYKLYMHVCTYKNIDRDQRQLSAASVVQSNLIVVWAVSHFAVDGAGRGPPHDVLLWGEFYESSEVNDGPTWFWFPLPSPVSHWKAFRYAHRTLHHYHHHHHLGNKLNLGVDFTCINSQTNPMDKVHDELKKLQLHWSGLLDRHLSVDEGTHRSVDDSDLNIY